MQWLETGNLKTFSLGAIPCLRLGELTAGISESLASGLRLVELFAVQLRRKPHVFAVMADDSCAKLFVAIADVGSTREYQSNSSLHPSVQMFERELFEQSGVTPIGHPWFKPVRRAEWEADPRAADFFRYRGDSVHEVAVGPIHAGIIEPGHFRFSCHGEEILNLEIRLGYQHRGVESLIVKESVSRERRLRLAESIAGDTVIGHAGCHVRAIEALGGTRVPERAVQLRMIALELERAANHIGDLSALAGDVAYLTGSSVFAALRTVVINSTMELCGSRFGRDLMTLGGVRVDTGRGLLDRIEKTVGSVEERFERAVGVMFKSASVLARFEKTGAIDSANALELGLVGPAARASGIARDVRADHPYELFAGFAPETVGGGDVHARAVIRCVETRSSLAAVRTQIRNLARGPETTEPGTPERDIAVVSMGESWRGETVHVALTDGSGKLCGYKICDPSFHNWPGLEWAVRGNAISDFPVSNKSFNLSYCGFDL